ncbi:zinc-binding dehydrogenase [Rhizobium leucaenae]|uniref:zinc-binding dehydrogenase n=1 Tax=Rhizobium leucaenae TaxID=29450 RepID=UPI001614FF8C|nr:NADPH:quinone reductase-like Zn-dependent oxidoreductase [Rhizobium leucaenae]
MAVRAFSLNRGELALMAFRPEGWRPGQDISGVVEVPASDGSGPAKGERIFGIVEGAGWSEKVAIRTDRLATLPQNISFEIGAALPMAGLTALRLTRLAGPLMCKRALVTGASGGVGHLLTQLLELAGADVGAVRSAGDAADKRYDVIFESVGGASMEEAVCRIAAHGTILSYGNTSGKKSNFDLLAFIGHESATIRTFFSYDPPGRPNTTEDLAALAELVATRRVNVQVGFTGDWGSVGDAIVGLRERTFKGKAVLTLPHEVT